MTLSKLRNSFAIALGQSCYDLIPMRQDEPQSQFGGDGLLQFVQSELELTPLTV